MNCDFEVVVIENGYLFRWLVGGYKARYFPSLDILIQYYKKVTGDA